MYLKKENTNIYYEVRGRGDALVLIHGVITDSAMFDQTAEYLSRFYNVIWYDRRGNSRSSTGTKVFDIGQQTDDIRDLLDELGIESAYIAGASAGAVIGLDFLIKYPERVRHLIMYEPAMLGQMLKDDPEFREWSEKTEALVEAGKLNSALLRFAAHIGPADSRSPVRSEEDSLRELGNLEYAMTAEIPGLLEYDPDPGLICLHGDKITVAAGEKSGDTAYVKEAKHLAEILGKKLLYYPGGHNLPYDLSEEFAACVLGTFMLRV